ncbi:blastula protease 10-like [Procambarus clarkii]|uniref:blastula protease 10-like n=1 Tax=Procambarus clarkii TaxID=6728 RepID=UPI003743A52F
MLDLIFTRKEEEIYDIQYLLPLVKSDHVFLGIKYAMHYNLEENKKVDAIENPDFRRGHYGDTDADTSHIYRYQETAFFSEQVEENSGDDRPYITPPPPKVTGAAHRRVLLDKGFEYTNPDFVDGKPLYQKDILLNPEQWQALRERKALASVASRWPEVNGFPLVPYITVSPVNVAAIRAGLQHWMANTCIKFTLTTNTKQPHLRFIHGSGCYSYYGRQAVNGQDVSIGVGCERVGIVAHEVGHAIGFVHEQSRPDRDTYVKINYQNVIPQTVHNFERFPAAEINNYSVPYDYSSDMHYGSSYFTSNGKLTISTVDVFAQGIIGQRTGLSHRDKRLANLMYNCIDKWLKACRVAKDPCKKGGYFGANCKCVCPPGTAGPLCQTVTGGYYDALRQPCSRTITTPGVITSPNYPNNYPAGIRGKYSGRVFERQQQVRGSSRNSHIIAVIGSKASGLKFTDGLFCPWMPVKV